MEMLTELRPKIDAKILERCSYVVEENMRVLNTCHSLKNNQIKSAGDYMYQSHEGLSKKYEVSCPELDFLVDKTRSMDYVAGSRMMGGGFGGCTINMVKSRNKSEFVDQMSGNYLQKFGLELDCYSIKISNGAGLGQE